MSGKNIHQVALNSISAHVAIIDENGVILETNRAWKEFACVNELTMGRDTAGLNYIQACEDASRFPDDEFAVVARGIRQVIHGEIEEFFVNYPCLLQREEKWYALRVVPLREQGSHKVVLSHEDITYLIDAQRTLAKKEEMLRDQAESLEENNIALKVLLKHQENDRLEMEEKVLMNVRQLILPYVKRLLNTGLNARQQTMVEIIRDRLSEMIGPFLKRLTALSGELTSLEIQVATLVREGKSSKEIADIMALSLSGVAFHRKQIRKKLNMTGSGRNLRAHLLTLK